MPELELKCAYVRAHLTCWEQFGGADVKVLKADDSDTVMNAKTLPQRSLIFHSFPPRNCIRVSEGNT